jgi:hypothetical protein
MRLADARHVHRLLAATDGSLLVTTGDLAAERRLYRCREEGRFECLLTAWSGFVAAWVRGPSVHFGTELAQGNGLVAFRSGLTMPPEFRRLPPALDLKVRDIVKLTDGTMLALLGMDEDLSDQRVGRVPTLLASRDDGRSWLVVHRFADWSVDPEALVPLGGMRVWVIGGSRTFTIEIDWAR